MALKGEGAGGVYVYGVTHSRTEGLHAITCRCRSVRTNTGKNTHRLRRGRY